MRYELYIENVGFVGYVNTRAEAAAIARDQYAGAAWAVTKIGR